MTECQTERFCQSSLMFIFFFNIWWPMPLFFIYYFTDGIETSAFCIQYLCLRVAGGVDERQSGSLLVWSCIDVIVIRVKVSRGIEPFSPMGIDSADTRQSPNGEICMDKSHLLPNNPARQQYRYTSVPIEAACVYTCPISTYKSRQKKEKESRPHFVFASLEQL